jgi:signal transduction histidine kinase
MPTDNGLVRYQVTSGNVKVYTTADGLGFDEFNRLAYAQGPDGRMYFGGLNGITAFHPDDLSEPLTTIPAPLVLKSIKLQREEGDRLEDLTADVLAGIPARMEPKDRFLAVEMALLSYEDPKLLTYSWRIDGIDVDWNNQREPFLRLTALPYGDHLLRIKAQDAEGRWTEEVHVPITRAAPLHLRWWFILLCVLLLAVAVFALVRYREQQLRRMIRMRDRIATDLHDEVGSNLSSIVLFSTAVGKHADTMPEYAAGMLQRIKDNSKRAMESMNDIVWSVNSGHDSMEDLVDRMRAFAEPLCEAAGITVEFDVDAVPLTRKLAMDQRKNLYLIFKEAVNNAVRHGRCQRITVTLRSVKDLLELAVTDDGSGVSETAARGVSLGGNGLGNMARRAREVGGEVQVVPGHNGGTTVLFRFVPVDE